MFSCSTSATPNRANSRYFLRILTLLTCGVFVFVFYFVNGVEQQAAKLRVVENQASSSDIKPYCVLPMYWAGQSSNYAVYYNFVPADSEFAFDESITYTTHATTKFLHHVEQIVHRWNGPVSVAIYAPATDFEDTLMAIQYLRKCRSPLVRHFTTFHLFYDAIYKSNSVPCSLDMDESVIVDCDTYVYPNRSYQTDNHLTYPVNVARNIARISAQTRYVLPSDIELYPSAGMIPMFLDMIATQQQHVDNEMVAATLGERNDSGNTNNITINVQPNNNNDNSLKTVYVLPLFEVDKSLSAPENKSQLLRLYKENKVVPFHKYVCPECHRVPKQNKWLESLSPNATLSVLFTTKRHKPYQNWEPIYIGTNQEPLYDERLNWEGMSDKMTQAYEMCLMDYDFSILDNAFLVHAPGIKYYSKNGNAWRKTYVSKNGQLRKQIKKELNSKHEIKGKCFL